jgi:phytoene dehydrogenase-like protein
MLPTVLAADAKFMEAGRWPREALRFSFEGSRGVGRPWARTGAVCQSITEQIQHLNAKVTAQARVNQPCVGSATPQSRITRRRT